MRNQTFYDWLIREVATSRMALVGLYEKKDKLLYVEAPPLRQRYMETIGIYEESVLAAELEVSMLRRKVEMIQIAINRREPVDLEAIDTAIEAERAKVVSDVEAGDKTLHELPQLSEQEEHTLQRQHREITAAFHPAMNPDITEAQKKLYEKAQDAYRLQDVEAMKLIYDMLFAPADVSAVSVSPDRMPYGTAERREEYREIASALSTDYKLAKQLYPFFMPLEEDSVIRSSLDGYDAQRRAVEEEIASIRAGFPFNAVATLNDKAKTEEYLAELRVRAKRCEIEKAELERQISTLTKGAVNG
ncbi:MAG: hypothetical protein E7423_04300 [Ruminococcaceae bacterium]|jgi:hypothetical protein|nr:hypothetical protein [Oscillospiraceae bacterium]